MNSRISLQNIILCLIALFIMIANSALARTFKQALPGYLYQFPRDHASHEEFKTEWWYYTGHLQTKSGKKFGYELTFFRHGIEEDGPVAINKGGNEAKQGTIRPGTGAGIGKQPSCIAGEMARNVYLAHFALTDESNRKFRFYERMSRSGLRVADARSDMYFVTNQGWSAESMGDSFVLKADSEGYGIHLLLSPAKAPVIHGKNGVSQKASAKGCASHYYSMTRLKTEGTLFLKDSAEQVSGLSWMDHEFGSNQLTAEQVGWDWFSIQLEDNREIMIYVMRRRDGTIDPNSSGTIVNPDGSTIHLSNSDFQIKPKSIWTSPHSKGKYPMGWIISIPVQKVTLLVNPVFEDQELMTGRSTGVTYWEGAANIAGDCAGKNVRGRGYVEMTGYSEAFKRNI